MTADVSAFGRLCACEGFAHVVKRNADYYHKQR